MDLEEMNDNTRNWVYSAQDRDYLRGPCECDTKFSGFISHGVSIPLHPSCEDNKTAIRLGTSERD